MAKSKLSAVIAVANGKKTQAKDDLTKLYHTIQKPDLLTGISRTYRPRDEDDTEILPAESREVQVCVPDVLDKTVEILAPLYDIVATQDNGNTVARADVEVNGKVILSQVPVTTLLYLEKQLNDLHTLYSALPTLSRDVEWEYDDNNRVYRTKSVETTRTKKIPYRFEKAPATDKHPAQVEVFHEDKIVGYWSKVDFSGSISPKEKTELIERVRKLRDAVVTARERANAFDVENVSIGVNVFNYLHGI